MKNIGVLGVGAWGLTIGDLCSRNGHNVEFWSHDIDLNNRLTKDRRHPVLVPHLILKKNTSFTTDLDKFIKNNDFIIIATASKFYSIIEKINKKELKKKPVLSVTKGLLEDKKSLFISDYIEEILGETYPFAILSGPNLATEISHGLPAATVIASKNQAVAKEFQKIISSDHFRVYTSSDLKGVELAGILKNSLAIASGLLTGMKLGDNARAALLTRGLVEINRFVKLFKVSEETMYGLAGMGDLIATCTSVTSRNFQVGMKLSEGKNLKQILEELNHVYPEGVKTTKLVYEIAKKNKLEMPIIEELYQILFDEKDPEISVKLLMTRPLKSEQ